MASFHRAQLLVVFVLGLLLMAAYSAEALRICQSRSKTFRGACRSSRLCTTVCHHENFTGGYCSRKYSAEVDVGDGVIVGDDDVLWLKSARCMCTKKCEKPPPGGGDEPPPGYEPEPPPGDEPEPAATGMTN